MAKHDENKDLRLVARICKIDFADKSIIAKKDSIIGIRTWGRIDYLCNHCGYRFYWTTSNISINKSSNYENKTTKREYKKSIKEQSLTDKTRKKRK